MSNALDAYPEMFPDRVTTQSVASTKDASGGRTDAWTTLATGVPCSVQPAGESDMLASHALGVEIQSQVYFPDDPGDLRDGSRLLVETLAGLAPARTTCLTVKRVARPGLADLVVWRADCQGRV